MRPGRRWDPLASSGLRVNGSFHQKGTHLRQDHPCFPGKVAAAALGLPGGRPQTGMTAERLNITQAAADLIYFAGSAGVKLLLPECDEQRTIPRPL